MKIPSGTSGVCLQQIFGNPNDGATAFMMRVYDGVLKRYRSEVLLEDVYDKWIHYNI